jgi:hypothetical protein
MGATSKFQLQSTKSQTNPKIEIQNMKHGSTLKHQFINRLNNFHTRKLKIPIGLEINAWIL